MEITYQYKDYGFHDQQALHSHSYLLPSIIKFLDKTKNLKILDVGCGNGWIACQLINLGFDVYGIDASESGIQAAKQTYPDRFYLQNLESNCLPEELNGISFDTIISTEVIEHLYSPTSFFEFCKTILLKREGELIISTPYHGYLKNLLLAFTGKMDQHFTVLWEGGHIKFWSVKSLKKILNEHNFKLIGFKGCGRIPLIWKSMLVKAIYGNIIKD
jgi:2-polyprenyl-3-methyl-5-hydroxy-6-metoxy-1,4-benzoquinol methylase